MQWLEIINIRLSRNDFLFNHKNFQNLVSHVQKEWHSSQIKFFQHTNLSADLSIFIYHQSTSPAKRGSDLGIHLAWLLEEFGSVNHTVWLEAKNSLKKGKIK